MANPSTARRMARLVSQWRASGESGASFARRHRVPPWTFWYWSRKLLQAPSSELGTVAASTFVPIHVVPETAVDVLEVLFAGGDRLHIRAGASPALVRAAVSALRSPC